MRIFIRGCPGQGTTWFASVVKCLFVGVTYISQHEKHHGCHINSTKDTSISTKILHPNCSVDCIHAVIAKHPIELKHGKNGAYLTWEAYYGAWARTSAKNVRLFRYEDLITKGCTQKRADHRIVSEYFRRPQKCVQI